MKREFLKILFELGRISNAHIVAEGIETQEQLTILQSTACNYGQGYLKSKPVTANQAIKLINKPL